MRILHLFDVDGTLLQVPEEPAFAQAFLECHGPGVDLTFDAKAPISDMGYVASVLHRHHGQPPRDADVAALLDRFVELLQAATHAGDVEIRPIEGAHAFVTALAAREAVALSTGCIERSARFKLAHVGLDSTFRCGGFSVGEQNRAEIVRRAIAAAEHTYGVVFDRVVLFGDGPWDLHSTQQAGVEFIGINESERGRDRLRRAGAKWVFADYADPDAIERAVREL